MTGMNGGTVLTSKPLKKIRKHNPPMQGTCSVCKLPLKDHDIISAYLCNKKDSKNKKKK